MKVRCNVRIFGGHQGPLGNRPFDVDVPGEASIREVIKRLQLEHPSGGQSPFLTDSGELSNMVALSIAGRAVGRDELGKSLGQFGEGEVSLDFILVQPIAGGA